MSHKQLNGSTPLHQAAQCGNELAIRYILGEDGVIPGGKKIDIDERDSNRATPLSVAATKGHESVVLLLLKHGAYDLGKGGTDRYLLSWVAGHGMTEALKSLLEMPEIIVDSLDGSYRTPLSWAAGNGHSDVVTQLLDPKRRNGLVANVNSGDFDNRTPLSWAAASEHEVVVKALLSYGADPTIKGLTLGSPITWAVTEGHSKVFSALIQSGKIEDEEMFDNSGNPLLALAAENGRTEIMTLLLDHNSPAINNPNAPKKTDGKTPLILAATNGHEEIVNILLSRGADVHITTPATNYTALLIAIEFGHWYIVEILIKHDYTVLQAKTIDDKIPIHLAVQTGHYEIVKFLLNSGFDSNASSSRSGNSLLHAAARQGHFLVLNQILEHAGHYLTGKNLDHQTPLILAAIGGHELVTTMLLDYARKKAIPNKDLVAEDPGTVSILTAAVMGGNAAVVRTILQRFPDHDNMLKSKDRHGWTPMTRAAESCNGEILRQLLRPENVNERDMNRDMGPLLWASRNGDEETVRLLLTKPELKTNLNRYAKDCQGANSLWYATWSKHCHIVKLLLADQSHHAASREQWLNAADRIYMMSPLHLAVHFRLAEIVKLLLEEQDIELNAVSGDGSSIFLSAVITGDEYLVRLLGEVPGVEVNHKDHQGRSALMLACRDGYMNIAKYLLRECESFSIFIDASDNKGQNALSHAIMGQGADAAIVKLLLDSHASIAQTFPPHNRNLLMLASACGSLPIVKLLCETKELDIEATDNEGFSALSLAAQRNLGNIVRLLLEKKANPNSRSRRSKRTPWMEAAISGSAAAVRELMLSPKIDLTCCNDANRSGTWFLMCGDDRDSAETSKYQRSSITEMVLEFHQENLSINEADFLGITPLHLLACSGAEKRFKLRRLLELKADLRYRSWVTGFSAFHSAALNSTPLILNELLEASGSDDTFDCKDVDHATPLSYAAGNSIKDHPVLKSDTFLDLKTSSQAVRCQMVRMLINRGADVNSVTLGEGRTPLMFAAHLGWNEVVALLLESGAGGTVVDTRDKNYATALSLAVISGHFATVQRLLEANASCKIKDKTGATMVIIAARNGHLPLLRLFLNSYKLSLNDRDTDGRTALSYAAEFGHKDVVHYLLEQLSLAEVDTLDRQDQTALVWACKKGYCVIISLLKDHGADHKHKDRNGRTPFSHAAEKGQTTVLRHLLLLEEENKENSLKMLEWKDDAGRTALSWAAEEGRLETVRLLLRWGTDPLSSNKRKMTPRMFALDKGHTQVAKLLASDHTSSGLIPGNAIPITRQPSLPVNLPPLKNSAIESENDSSASISALNLSGQATGASGGGIST